MDQVQTNANTITVAINILWVLIAGFLVFFMQAGFALVETGFTRAKNVSHTMMMNMMVFCLGAVGYWICGFAFQFGAVNKVYPATPVSSTQAAAEWAFSPVTLGSWADASGNPLLTSGLALADQWGLVGLSGFFLQGIPLSVAGILAFFLFQMVFMDTAATIPTGSGAERMKFSGFVVMSLLVSMLIYPIAGNWVWGGGFLANLGRTLGWGNGAADFAGSGVVHMTGGAVALALAIAIGPRIGRFNKDGSANAMPGHNIPMGVLGTIILFFGWFGFNPGSALGLVVPAADATGAAAAWPINLVAVAAVNTLIAGAVGGVSAMAYCWLVSPAKKPTPSLSVNGVLAGLVAVTAPCAFIDTTAAAIIGLVSGVLVCWATAMMEKRGIDDPVGAVPVHFVNGMWGVLAVGIFATGNPDTAAWNGMDSAVTGIIAGGYTQILAQIAEVAAIATWAFGVAFVSFKVLHRMGILRSRMEDELAGLDMPEMGEEGYVAGDVPVPGGQVLVPGTVPAPAASAD